MKIPVEKSIYRKVYLQLRTGFLTERPLFYDAVRTIPPPVFTRTSDKLPNLVGLEDRLMRKFQAKYPYHFEDFVSDHPESTQYVAYNFAKKQAALMNQGLSEKRAFERVEKEYLAEMDAINARVFEKKEESKKSEKEKMAYQYMHPDTMFHGALTKELNRQQRVKIHNVIDRTVNDYKRQYGDHVIEEKLKALEHYRLDKPKSDEELEAVAKSTQSVPKQKKQSARKQEPKKDPKQASV